MSDDTPAFTVVDTVVDVAVGELLFVEDVDVVVLVVFVDVDRVVLEIEVGEVDMLLVVEFGNIVDINVGDVGRSVVRELDVGDVELCVPLDVILGNVVESDRIVGEVEVEVDVAILSMLLDAGLGKRVVFEVETDEAKMGVLLELLVRIVVDVDVDVDAGSVVLEVATGELDIDMIVDVILGIVVGVDFDSVVLEFKVVVAEVGLVWLFDAILGGTVFGVDGVVHEVEVVNEELGLLFGTFAVADNVVLVLDVDV